MPELDLKTSENILIRAPNWVGDVVMAVPFYRCIRENFPHAGIYCCIRDYVSGILNGSPWFDGIISGNDKTLAGLMAISKEIRRVRPKTAFILPRSFNSLLTAYLGGVKRIYSYKQKGRGFFFTDGPIHPKAIKGTPPVSTTTHYLNLAKWFGLKMPDSIRPELFITRPEMAFAEEKLKTYGIAGHEMVIGLNPGARFGSSKCWMPEYFARLAEMLQNRLNCRILIFAGPGEGEIAAEIQNRSRADIINTFNDGITLSRLKPMIQRCDLLITNDTGPRHYAVAFGVPVVVIMGPTDPAYTNDHLEKTVVIRKELDCSPCHLETCPKNHECMKTITPEEVFDQAMALLEKYKK